MGDELIGAHGGGSEGCSGGDGVGEEEPVTAAAEAAPLRRVAGIRAAMARVGVRRAAGRMAAVTKTAVERC